MARKKREPVKSVRVASVSPLGKLVMRHAMVPEGRAERVVQNSWRLATARATLLQDAPRIHRGISPAILRRRHALPHLADIEPVAPAFGARHGLVVGTTSLPRRTFRGLFTTRPIPKYGFIGIFTGELTATKPKVLKQYTFGSLSLHGEEYYITPEPIPLLTPPQVDAQLYPMAMINEPPAGTKANAAFVEWPAWDGVSVHAARDIPAGAEIFVHYRRELGTYPRGTPSHVPQGKIPVHERPEQYLGTRGIAMPD